MLIYTIPPLHLFKFFVRSLSSLQNTHQYNAGRHTASKGQKVCYKIPHKNRLLFEFSLYSKDKI